MPPRLSTYSERFLEHHLTNKTQNTALAYRNDLRQFEAFLKARSRTVRSADAHTVDEYLQWLERDLGRTPWSVHRAATSIRRLYAFYDRPLPKRIYPVAASTSKVPSTRRALTVKQVDRLFDAIGDDTAAAKRDRAMFMLMYGLGFVVKDVLDLNLNEVSLRSRLIRPKGKHGSRRMVPRALPLGGEVETALGAWLGAGGRRDFALQRGVTIEPQAVFVGRNGKRLTRQGLTFLLQRYSAEAGLPNAVSPMWLRDTFTRDLVRSGADPEDIGLISGSLTHVGPARNTQAQVDHYRQVLEQHHAIGHSLFQRRPSGESSRLSSKSCGFS